jgi:pimeloyl-ACP methyl ester carboxylesterase
MTTLIVSSVKVSTGVTLEFVEQGNVSGIPIVCLHGVTDSWHSFEPVLPYLPEDLRVFAITQRGHGGSSKPAAGYRYVDFAADVRAFMDALMLPDAIVAGHSMGSLVAQRVAVDYPHRVRGLALMGAFLTIHGDRGLESYWESTLAPLPDPVPREIALEFQLSTLERPIAQSWLDLFVAESQRVPAGVWRATFREFLDTNFSAELSMIAAPTLMIWGEKDAYCGPTHWAGLQKAIPHANARIYEGTGHALHWEQPERFAKDLATFARGVR